MIDLRGFGQRLALEPFDQGRLHLGRLLRVPFLAPQRVLGHRDVPVPELAGKLHFGRDVSQILEQAFAHSARVKRRAASTQHDAFDIAQFAGGHVESTKFGARFFDRQPSAHRVSKSVRLLKDFFEHIMRKRPFIDIFGAEFDLADLKGRVGAGKPDNIELPLLDGHHVIVVQIDHIARMGDDRADVTDNEILSLAYAQDQRTSPPCAQNDIRYLRVKQRQPIGPHHLL